MRLFRFLFFGILTFGLTWTLNTYHPFGVPIPALGALFDPVAGFWANADAKPIATDQLTLSAPGLNGKVEVVFDERLVPHIFADNFKDAVFAQGYVTAMHRLWQMDISYRAGAGRLSEVLGERTLENDQNQRRKGLLRAAKVAFEALKASPEDWPIVEAYTAGVNAYIATLTPATYPLEFKLLGYKPEPWTALKTAVCFKNMAETLCYRHADLPNSNARALFGPALFDFLYPSYNPKQSPVIPATVKWDFKPIAIAPPSEKINLLSQTWPKHKLPMPDESLGSNNWAVAGSKTASGRPIICNDPHLNLTLPSIWYETQIHTPETNVYGVTIPGLPCVIIGFNENIGWAVTNVGQDVLDWYAIKWLDDAHTTYAYDDQKKKVDIQYDTVFVRGRKEPVIEAMKFTVWGPVAFENAPKSPYRGLAMHWLAAEKPEKRAFYEVGTFMRLNKAKNYLDYATALTGYDAPAQNFAFACRDGDIALKVNGKFPIKTPGQGRFVQDGSASSNAWHGYIPRAQIPQILNPERGFVASANQNSASPAYPYYYNGEFDDYRGRLINRRLAEMNKITIQDMMQLQTSSYSLLAEEATPLLLKLLPRNGLNTAEKALVKELETWDYKFRYDATTPVVFQALMDSVYRFTFDEILLQPDSIELARPRTWRFLELLDLTPDHPIFDQLATKNKKEQASDLVLEAFHQVAKEWTPKFKAGFNWRQQNKAEVRHLARIPAFTRSDLAISGYRQAPNASNGGNGPSWRMVVELGPEVKAYGVFPGGQSGNPGNPNYDAMIPQWVKGEYNELFFMKNAQDRRQKVVAQWTLAK